MDYFKKIITHYLIQALEKAGVPVDSDAYAELDGMVEALDDHITERIRTEIDLHEIQHRA